MQRLRKESFMLTPPSLSRNKSTSKFDDDLIKELDEVEKEHYNNSINQNIDTNEKEAKSVSFSETSPRPRTISDIKRDFQLGDIMEFVHKGLEVCL